jgi:hypothetical protein
MNADRKLKRKTLNHRDTEDTEKNQNLTAETRRRGEERSAKNLTTDNTDDTDLHGSRKFKLRAFLNLEIRVIRVRLVGGWFLGSHRTSFSQIEWRSDLGNVKGW